MQVLKSIPRSPFCSLVFTSVVCMLGAGQAAASPPVETRSVTVNYRDLNLSTIEGATTLYQRLKGAASKVCDGPQGGLHAWQEWRSCYRAAMADAVSKVNSPLLTAVYKGPNSQATTTAMLTK